MALEVVILVEVVLQETFKLMNMREKHFINLTNGIEKIPELLESNIPFEFCYIASTTIERKDYIKLFLDLDHNLLLNLAIGNKCYFYDYGTNRVMSKTCYSAVPLINYILTRYWLSKDDINLCYRYTRTGKEKLSVGNYYNYIYEQLFLYDSNSEKQKVKTKLKKYKNKFLLTKEIQLIPISKSTINDGDYEFYKQILSKL